MRNEVAKESVSAFMWRVVMACIVSAMGAGAFLIVLYISVIIGIAILY